MALDSDLYTDLDRRCLDRGIHLSVVPTERRSQTKKLLLQEVIAEGPLRKRVSEDVQGRVPLLYLALCGTSSERHTEKSAHGELIRVLQRLEGWLVVEQIAPLLVENGVPVVTLHDALYVREQDAESAKAAFQQTCGRLGLEHVRLK